MPELRAGNTRLSGGMFDLHELWSLSLWIMYVCLEENGSMVLKESHVFLENLRFYAYHGVLPQERVVGGDYLVSVRVGISMAKAMVSDNVDDTANYAELYEIINKEMQTPSNLLEHLAGRIGEAILEKMPGAGDVKIRITKRNPPMGADVDGAGVEICVTREP